MTKADFSQWLRGLMDERGLSAAEMAHVAKVSKKSIYAWIQDDPAGPMHPGAIKAQIERALGIDNAALLTPEEHRRLGPEDVVRDEEGLDARFPRAVELLRTILSMGDEILRTAIINNLEGFARAARDHVQVEALAPPTSGPEETPIPVGKRRRKK